ncbi:MAG TPA: hypothetical protein VGD10_08315 [Allosphingosinicella sp.]|uniref:hypothetical protein n=1 Tax=Allosphingosinicella sp. TaxID=2823234 RepID=UPI002ED782BB
MMERTGPTMVGVIAGVLGIGLGLCGFAALYLAPEGGDVSLFLMRGAILAKANPLVAWIDALSLVGGGIALLRGHGWAGNLVLGTFILACVMVPESSPWADPPATIQTTNA